MTEATVVNLFTVVRVLLVGGILLILPLITRKGLMFGVYVGEEFAEGNAARRIKRRWNLGCLTLIVVSLAVGLGISVAGHPVTGNLTATAILLLSCLGLYLHMYYTARAVAPPAAAHQADSAVAPIDVGEPKGATLAKITLVICLLASLATVFYSMVSYEAMPDRVPSDFGLSGEADAWSDKSVVSVMLMPTLNLVLCPFLALLALLTARAKRSLRGGRGGRSIEAQNAFRGATSRLLSGVALITCALMSYLSVQSIRIGLGEIPSLGPGVLVFLVAMILFMFGGLIWIIVKHGQGGALAEEGSVEAPLTNGIADNSNWVWGVFYVNKDDPSIMVEKRFGVGYTINFGNRWAVVLMATFLLLILGLTAVGVIDSMR